jgi:hypothetical protein
MAHALQVTRDIAVREPRTDSRRSSRLQRPTREPSHRAEHWKVAREPFHAGSTVRREQVDPYYTQESYVHSSWDVLCRARSAFAGSGEPENSPVSTVAALAN